MRNKKQRHHSLRNSSLSNQSFKGNLHNSNMMTITKSLAKRSNHKNPKSQKKRRWTYQNCLLSSHNLIKISTNFWMKIKTSSLQKLADFMMKI